MSIRVYALWGCKTSMFVVLSMLKSTLLAGSIYTTYRFVNAAIPLPNNRIFPSGCLMTFSSRIEWIAEVFLIVSETFLVCLLLFKSLAHYHRSNSTLLNTMHEDGLIFFASVLATTVASLIVLRIAGPDSRDLLFFIQALLHSIICNRLLLRLRKASDSLHSRSLSVGSISFLRPRTTSGVLSTTGGVRHAEMNETHPIT